MRYMWIEIEGETSGRAAITRRRVSPTEVRIVAEVDAPSGPCLYMVRSNDPLGQWQMAERMQAHLDGEAGTGAHVRAYFRAIRRFADRDSTAPPPYGCWTVTEH